MMIKLVDVESRFPITVRQIPVPIMGNIYNTKMTTDQIFDCICARAVVREVLPNGERLILTLANYDKDNTPKIDKQENKEDSKTTPISESEEVESNKDLEVKNEETIENENDSITVEGSEDETSNLEAELKAPVVQYNRGSKYNGKNYNNKKKYKK